MSEKTPEELVAEAKAWWTTEIIDIHPGKIAMRGYAIQELIGAISFPQMIWLMLRGELPTPAQAGLLEAALVASVDHGPHAPSIAIARIAATTGIDLNNVMASAVNVLGDVHGGAGQQCMELYEDDRGRSQKRTATSTGAVDDGVEPLSRRMARSFPASGTASIQSIRAARRCLRWWKRPRAQGGVSGRYAAIGREVEAGIKRRTGKPIPMNIDGVTGDDFLRTRLSRLRWGAACSFCRARSASWPTPGKR